MLLESRVFQEDASTRDRRPKGADVSCFSDELARFEIDTGGRRWLFVPYDQLSERIGPLSREDPSECHGDCEMPGYVESAATRGAELKIEIDDAANVFCSQPLGEVADT
jgi:hypothetical protein